MARYWWRIAASVTIAAIGSSLAVASPAQAASGRSDACFSYACGSITPTRYTTGGSGSSGWITYSVSVKDTICNSGSDARIVIRVWYTDGSSSYGNAVVYDDNACDGSYGQQSGLRFTGIKGKELAYFRAVVRDSNHPNGDLGTIRSL